MRLTMAFVASILIPGCLQGAPSTGSATSELGSPFATEMASLNPTDWWRLGEASGTNTATDSGSAHHNGTYTNFSSGQHAVAGAIADDTDGAIAISPTSSNYIELGDQDDFSLTKANDSFDRVGSNGWGTADHGGAWTPEVTTTPSYYSTDGSVANITESASATWQIGLESVQRSDADIQVRASWTASPTDGNTIAPLSIVARRASDNSSSYRVELMEASTTGALSLRLVAVSGGSSQQIGSTVPLDANYTVGAWWYVRFQLQGTALRARAWAQTSTEPTTWAIDTTDSTVTGPGSVSIRSSNSPSSVRPTVSFEGFQVQSVGMTVHAFMKPTATSFNGGAYVYFLGKGATPQAEWAFRFYPDPSNDGRPNRVSGYIWNLDGNPNNMNNEGAGADYQPSGALSGWHEVVVVYDPGNALDPHAGATMYFDGACIDGPHCSLNDTGALYSTSPYLVYPLNGSDSLHIGTRELSTFFTGDIDEVAIFDRALSLTEIQSLHMALSQ